MTKEFWNDRFSPDVYFYGKEPNPFFKEQIAKLPKGKILFPAEGEGRNAVYAAKLGFDVVAFDQSEAGYEKTLALAREHNTTLQYDLTDLDGCNYPTESFDGIVIAFLHLPVNLRQNYHQKLLSFVKPNGWVILEGFQKKQIERNSGGPKNESMLFSREELENDFKDLSTITIQESDTYLNAGIGHVGNAFLIQLIGER